MTRSRLVADLRRIGVRAGGITMVHTRMSAIGWVVGGARPSFERCSRRSARTERWWLSPPGTITPYAFGTGSPLARLVAAGGQVLMLGAPLETITLLHHAEAIARVPEKRRVTFQVPVVERGRIEQRVFTDIETTTGAFP